MTPRQKIDKVEWDEFCLSHPCCWFFHSSAWLDYQVVRGATDLSFALIGERGIDAVFPLMTTNGEALFEGHPGPGPCGTYPDRGAVRDDLDTVLRANSVTRASFRSHPFGACKEPRCPGWTTRSWQTQVVDLTFPIEILHADLRKSYTSLINHVNGSHEITVDWRGDLIESFRQLHAADAGRETRPRETWEMQRQWCEDGHGLIVGASLGGVLVAATYWIIYKSAAYYASSASLHKNVTHALIWRAMLELKKAGVEQLELGWLDYDKSEKGQGIAKFKSGFGGEARMIYAVEKVLRECA